MNQKHRSFLIDLGTIVTEHSGRTLFDHLKGTHDLLRDWGNDEDVCNAGLFHSIYGTKTFHHVSITDRRAVREQIGDYAELLVTTFRTKDRPFFASIMNERMRSQLMEIEAANLLEQGANKKTLQALAKKKISSSARAAIMMELAK